MNELLKQFDGVKSFTLGGVGKQLMAGKSSESINMALSENLWVSVL